MEYLQLDGGYGMWHHATEKSIFGFAAQEVKNG